MQQGRQLTETRLQATAAGGFAAKGHKYTPPLTTQDHLTVGSSWLCHLDLPVLARRWSAQPLLRPTGAFAVRYVMCQDNNDILLTAV